MKPVIVSSFYVYGSCWLIAFFFIMDFIKFATAKNPLFAGLNAIAAIIWVAYPYFLVKSNEIKFIDPPGDEDD